MSESKHAEALKALDTEHLQRTRDNLVANMGKPATTRDELERERRDLAEIDAELARREADAAAVAEENSVGTTLLAARGFNGLIALCRELVGGVQQIGSPVELEEAIEYARDAKARAIVGNADREVLDKIDVDVVALEVALEARRTILELAERLEARANLTL